MVASTRGNCRMDRNGQRIAVGVRLLSRRPGGRLPVRLTQLLAIGRWIVGGRANGILIPELSGGLPSRALDVAGGEEADAIWPARAGWQAIGVDMSAVRSSVSRSACDGRMGTYRMLPEQRTGLRQG
jgi:hypothetical protein